LPATKTFDGKSTDTIRVELQDGLAILGTPPAQPARGNPFDGAFGRDFKQVASEPLELRRAARRAAARRTAPTSSFGGDLKAFYPAARSAGAAWCANGTAELHMGLQRFWRLAGAGRQPPCRATRWAAAWRCWPAGDVVLGGPRRPRIGSAFAQLGFQLRFRLDRDALLSYGCRGGLGASFCSPEVAGQ